MTAPTRIADLARGKGAAADGFVRADVDAVAWTQLAEGLATGSCDLVSEWADGANVHLALFEPATGTRLVATLASKDRAFPSVGRLHAPAIRLERAIRDLYALEPVGLPDARPWLDHGAWKAAPPTRGKAAPQTVRPYAFLRAEGPALHQIPVGPVHAGIIEPGHFRFSASGETVVRLEERLGYVHKGVDALAPGKTLEEAARLAGRISGDSTVAYAFAFARAVEALLGWKPPPRAVLLRGIMAELERMAHHVSDFGAVCNDASVMAILARCMLIREDILTTCGAVFGHRLMMDRIVPGGVSCALDGDGADKLRSLLDRIEQGFRTVVKVYEGMPSLQDRTVTTGIVTPELARRFAAGGYVGRASGRAFDARTACAYPPYDKLDVNVPVRPAGDVDSRLWIRVEEVRESLRLVRIMLEKLQPGPLASRRPAQPQAKGTPQKGAALVEAFRGDVFMSVRLDADGRVARLHARDASWFQWPLLEAAIEGNIVADFPLCNKSFNCSYSGHDL